MLASGMFQSCQSFGITLICVCVSVVRVPTCGLCLCVGMAYVCVSGVHACPNTKASGPCKPLCQCMWGISRNRPSSPVQVSKATVVIYTREHCHCRAVITNSSEKHLSDAASTSSSGTCHASLVARRYPLFLHLINPNQRRQKQCYTYCN